MCICIHQGFCFLEQSQTASFVLLLILLLSTQFRLLADHLHKLFCKILFFRSQSFHIGEGHELFLLFLISWFCDVGGYPEATSEPACKCKKQEREICSSVWECSCLIFSASTNKATIHRGERHITWYSISFTCCTILFILIWTTTTSKYGGWQEAGRRGSASGPSTCVIAHEIHSCHCRT
jgi:hypothetical protein